MDILHLKRMVLAIASALGVSSAVLGDEFSFDSARITAPAGWREIKKTDDLLILESPDRHQSATVSAMAFTADASFEDFKKLCQHRLEAERKDSSDVFVESDAPFEEAGGFRMFFSGGDKKTKRLFSGYLSLEKRELITIYVEGIGVAARDVLETLKTLTTELKRT